MTKLILVVDDEQDLVDTLGYNLESAGYQTRTAMTGAQALEQARLSPPPDLILLDLMLPDISGIEVCRQLRADADLAHVPIVMLTARGDETDRVVGFELGADDYVVKPFSVRELLLRVRAILKRSTAADGGSSVMVFDELRVDRDRHAAWVSDDKVHLTALEFKLLVTLLERRGRVQSRATLLSDVWGIDAEVTTRTVDTHVKRLREKLGTAARYIETLRGVGYRFTDQPTESTT